MEKKLVWPKKLESSTSPSNPYLWGEEMRAIRLKAKSSSSIGLKLVLPPMCILQRGEIHAVDFVNSRSWGSDLYLISLRILLAADHVIGYLILLRVSRIPSPCRW
ncbi:unnamed protein product [Prunus armeniaca]|uniref:Uncharacterized protein n=1 Tax=Prunus armeniaca TaxID=36596 RepID=A0A6J5X2L9_PRUAR|nr:unnamed protein product [Prunus armeniaca]